MPTSKKFSEKKESIIVLLAAFVIVAAGLREASTIIVPVLLSVFIAIISSPALFWLESKKVPRILAFTIVVAFVIVVLTVIGLIISSSVSSFMKDFPEYQIQLKNITNSILTYLVEHKFPFTIDQLMANFNPAVILNFAGYMLGNIGSILSSTLLIFITVAFMLFESSSFPRKIKAINLDPNNPHQPIGIFTKNIKKYFAIKTLTSITTGVLVVILLWFFGIEYLFLWGLLAFFFNFIPNIGSIIAAIPPILLALIQYGWQTALWVAIGYLLINITIGNIIEPKFMGKGLGLSTLVVFLSLLLWGWLLGPVGMFLSVPLTMTAKIACDSNKNTKWIGTLLGA